MSGPTTVKSGRRTVALLVPFKAPDPDRLAAVLTRAEALAKGHDPVADDAALAPFRRSIRSIGRSRRCAR
ncbi:MAG: hypothetical protein JO358_12205 [Alphaproteobacteria bacterium]|nr:hypothetical protein [Alphaproteobacteria bacterium]